MSDPRERSERVSGCGAGWSATATYDRSIFNIHHCMHLHNSLTLERRVIVIVSPETRLEPRIGERALAHSCVTHRQPLTTTYHHLIICSVIVSLSNMSTPSSPAATASASATSRPNPRQAALLAAEARLRPASSSSSSNPATTSPESAVASASGSSTPPLFQSGGNGASAGTRKWTPTEKEERDCRIKFARLLDRGLVRDNGYRQVADGVEVSLVSPPS